MCMLPSRSEVMRMYIYRNTYIYIHICIYTYIQYIYVHRHKHTHIYYIPATCVCIWEVQAETANTSRVALELILDLAATAAVGVVTPRDDAAVRAQGCERCVRRPDVRPLLSKGPNTPIMHTHMLQVSIQGMFATLVWSE